MTDKQVKEGIDISQCECYSVEDNSCNKTLSGSCMKEKCQTFRLLQTIQAKEQECKKKSRAIGNLGYKIKNQRKEINIRLEQLNQLKVELEQEKALKETYLTCYKAKHEDIEGALFKLKQTLAEIKEITEPYKMTIKKICGNCKKYDDCHACCYKDINCYKYTSSETSACEEFTYLDEFIPNLLANNILQKISEVVE